MGRTQYLTATTLDGYIADADGSLQWLFDAPHGEDSTRWDRFIRAVGAMVMGSTTYEWAVQHDDLFANPARWHEYYGDLPCWVLTTRDLPSIPGADITFAAGDVAEIHSAVAAAAGDKNTWLVGGGNTVGRFVDADLVDEIHASIAPVLLGAGAQLLPRRVEGMRLVSAEQDGQRLNVVYELPGHQTSR